MAIFFRQFAIDMAGYCHDNSFKSLFILVVWRFWESSDCLKLFYGTLPLFIYDFAYDPLFVLCNPMGNEQATNILEQGE